MINIYANPNKCCPNETKTKIVYNLWADDKGQNKNNEDNNSNLVNRERAESNLSVVNP